MPSGGHNKTHGQQSPDAPMHREWKAWVTMRYKHGDMVCKRWERSATAFLSDMGKRQQGKILCRKRSDHKFSPKNCYWGWRSS